MKKTLAILLSMLILPVNALAQTETLEISAEPDTQTVTTDNTANNEGADNQPQNEPATNDDTAAVQAQNEAAKAELEQTLTQLAAAQAELAATQAQQDELAENQSEQNIVQKDIPQNSNSNGFSLLAHIGGTVAFKEYVSSGFQDFKAKAAGFQANIDVGYRWEYFGVFVEGMLRATFPTEDSLDTHCPGWEDHCYHYKSLKKSEWDGYVGGIGLLFMGFIPATNIFTLSIGAGGLVYLGKSVNDVDVQSQFVVKFELGFHFAVSDSLALGLTIAEEGWFDKYRGISPAFTITYINH